MNPARPRERPSLPIQPEPTHWFHSFMPGPIGGVTAITRIWRPGDSRHCRLCSHCTAAHRLGVCQVQVRGAVDPASLPLLSLRGRTILGAAEDAHDGVVGSSRHGDAVG
jgi:hypothetical protein